MLSRKLPCDTANYDNLIKIHLKTVKHKELQPSTADSHHGMRLSLHEISTLLLSVCRSVQGDFLVQDLRVPAH